MAVDSDLAFGEERDIGIASDPLEPVNRVFFHFNDKLYFWVVKPAAQGYSYFIAEDVRMCVRSFFKNLLAPVRIVNNLLQGKVANTGVETARFVINSTLGIVGLADPAKNE
ncbi:MAG: VacJ family lipoprotein, partial [Proteobacteria bacterium]|nr:VacJ family lipoprotein [Pseudomonadota bacterium]